MQIFRDAVLAIDLVLWLIGLLFVLLDVSMVIGRFDVHADMISGLKYNYAKRLASGEFLAKPLVVWGRYILGGTVLCLSTYFCDSGDFVRYSLILFYGYFFASQFGSVFIPVWSKLRG